MWKNFWYVLVFEKPVKPYRIKNWKNLSSLVSIKKTYCIGKKLWPKICPLLGHDEISFLVTASRRKLTCVSKNVSGSWREFLKITMSSRRAVPASCCVSHGFGSGQGSAVSGDHTCGTADSPLSLYRGHSEGCRFLVSTFYNFWTNFCEISLTIFHDF